MVLPHTPALTVPAFEAARLRPDVDAYLAASEARYPDIRPGAAKRVVWANPVTRQRTPVALVYIHGFSASAEEIRPLPDRVATAIGANLYYTRLAGHGRTSDAMGETRLDNWYADFSESLAIGEALGEQVVLIGTSTGASLITAALADPQIRQRVSAVVFISPNYGVASFGAFLLATPLGPWLATLLVGPTYSFVPTNEQHAAHWTTRYPSSALLPMAALVKVAVDTRVEEIGTPALFLYSSDDQVVQPDKTRNTALHWGGSHEIVDVGVTGDPSNHVIAGDILSPATTEPLADRIVLWLRMTLNLR